jgi:hypothetical protein
MNDFYWDITIEYLPPYFSIKGEMVEPAQVYYCAGGPSSCIWTIPGQEWNS